MAGEEQAIKAYSIAVDVFGRTTDFDPQADPIVRVQARRLRSLLDEYYAGEGLGETVQIRLPVGRYVPEFVASDAILLPAPFAFESAVPVQAMRHGPPRTWYTLAMLAVIIVAAAIALSNWGPEPFTATSTAGVLGAPRVGVYEFQNLTGGTLPAAQVAGLAIELVTDFLLFDNIAVTYRQGGGATGPAEIPAANDFVLTGIVRRDGDLVQYSALLTDSLTSGVVWSHTLSVPVIAAAQAGILDQLANSFSLILGSPRGPLHQPARDLMAGATAPTAANPYLCRVLFDRYRETGTSDEAEHAIDCYAALSETEKQNPLVLAAMGSLMVEYFNPASASHNDPEDRVRVASANIKHALELNPTSGFIWEQQARLHEGEGNLRQARADYASSVQLNPASADALAAYARLLALSGSLDEAEPYAREAAEQSPAPPASYFAVPTLLALRDGDFPGAVYDAALYADFDRELGPVLAIMAAEKAGNNDVVNRYLPEVLDMPSFKAKGVLPRLRERITDDALIMQIRTALQDAGVPWATLTRPSS